MAEACEWDPVHDRPAAHVVADDPTQHAEAVWSVGVRPSWHLCESCAALPRFKRFRRRSRLSSGVRHG
jgi:hypothetical protein